jgi:hypothetical protein
MEDILKCAKCKGTNIMWCAYVDQHDNVIEGSQASDTWCDDCCDHVDVIDNFLNKED